MNPIRPWWQFTLRQLLYGIGILCVCLGFSSRWYLRYRAQDAAKDIGGSQGYRLERDDQGRERSRDSAILNFISEMEDVSYLDRDMFFQVTYLSYEGMSRRVSDEDVAKLQGLLHLEYLDLIGASYVTDRSVPALARMKSLELLAIDRTGFTSQGAAELRAALPNTKIYYELSDSEWRKREGHPPVPPRNEGPKKLP